MVSRLLHAAIPIGSAALGAVLPERELKRVREELELMKALAERLPAHGHDGLLPIERVLPMLDPEDNPIQGIEGAGLRALRSVLVELDQAMLFGDLRRVVAPSGEYLWVCPRPEHRRVYDPGLPALPA